MTADDTNPGEDQADVAALIAGQTLADNLAPVLDLDAGLAEVLQHASANTALEKLNHLQTWLNNGAIVSLRHPENLQVQSEAWHEVAALVAAVAVSCAHAGADTAKLAGMLASRSAANGGRP